MYQPVFDSHLHIIDPAYPLVENTDYRDRIAGLGLEGGAVVAGSFQAFDQGYLVRRTLEPEHRSAVLWDNAAAFDRPQRR